LKKEKKSLIRKKKLCRPTVPKFFGDVSGNKEHFFTPYGGGGGANANDMTIYSNYGSEGDPYPNNGKRIWQKTLYNYLLDFEENNRDFKLYHSAYMNSLLFTEIWETKIIFCMGAMATIKCKQEKLPDKT